MDAAEYWAGGAEIDDTAEDAKVFGLQLPESERTTDFEVIPEAWPAVEMFLRLQTQWRVSDATVLGLDYKVVEWFFSLYQVENQRELIEDLQIMEGKVVETLSKRRK